MFRKIVHGSMALAILALGAAGAASAQQYGYAPVRVAYATPEVSRYRVRGWVSNFDRFSMTVRADGRVVPVNLHQGTVILPTGLTLQPGMFVNVDGFWVDGGFHADRIVLVR